MEYVYSEVYETKRGKVNQENGFFREWIMYIPLTLHHIEKITVNCGGGKHYLPSCEPHTTERDKASLLVPSPSQIGVVLDLQEF